MNQADIIVSIECCRDCKSHQWNTRHDQSRYEHFFAEFQKEAKTHVGSATFSLNHIPTKYLESDCFKTLTQIDSVSQGFQPIRPRLGAFQVYLQSYCIYSKLATGLWPHIPSVIKKLQKAVEALQEGNDLAQFAIQDRKTRNTFKASPSPGRNRSNSRSKVTSFSHQNITPLRSSFKSPKPFKNNASPPFKPPRSQPNMIQNNIAIIHGYQGNKSNEDVTSSPGTKSSSKSLKNQEPLARTILETKEKPPYRRQSNEDKDEPLQEHNDQKVETTENNQTEQKEDQKETQPQYSEPLQSSAAQESEQTEVKETELSHAKQEADQYKPEEQAQSEKQEIEEPSQAKPESEEAQVIPAQAEQSEALEKEEEQEESQSAAKQDSQNKANQEQPLEESKDQKPQLDESKQADESYQADYTFEKEETTERVGGEQEAKDDSEEKRDTLEQLPSQKPSKMSLNEFKREDTSERYEESFEQSESMNESTVAQRLAMATIERAKESIKNQIEVQTETSGVSKKATLEQKEFDSKIED